MIIILQSGLDQKHYPNGKVKNVDEMAEEAAEGEGESDVSDEEDTEAPRKCMWIKLSIFNKYY